MCQYSSTATGIVAFSMLLTRLDNTSIRTMVNWQDRHKTPFHLLLVMQILHINILCHGHDLFHTLKTKNRVKRGSIIFLICL